jgi:CRP-like cAMP-binding protein
MNEPLKTDLPETRGTTAAPALAATGALPALDDCELRARIGPLRVVHINHRGVIYREARDAQAVHLVVDGLVKLVSHVTDERTRIVRLLSAGDFLGLEGLFQPSYRQTAAALGKVSLYRIPVAALRRLRASDPAFYCRLLEAWYVHLQYADTWITQFSTGPIRPRVARLLRFLARAESAVELPRVRLLTCDEAAEVLGVTPESVSRYLAEFKRDRLLRRASPSDPDMFFCDLAGLHAVANGTA